MGYHMDLSKIELNQFKERLKGQYLLPSQKILENDLEKSFKCLKENELFTMSDLQDALKSKIRVSKFSIKSGLTMDYLTVLRREVNSYLPKFKSLDEFPDVSAEAVGKLKSFKIENTYHFFEYVKTEENRKELCDKTLISYEDIMDLTRLTDLSRIKWVGPIFARLLILSGYDTVEKVTKANYRSLYDKLKKINEEKKYYRGQFGLNDVKLLVRISKNIPLEIEY